jgi:Putative MetA-pathway of phenol degradation
MLNYSEEFPSGLLLSSLVFKRKQLNLKYFILSISIALCCGKTAYGQTTNKFDFERIEDNSFLIEEAYNQDPGVIQHISSFQYMKDRTWMYTFTDEWPVPGRKHQLSTAIPVLNNGETGLGDILLNYRYQAIYMNRFAFSPRFSLILPTGNWEKGLGTGVVGYQLSFPFSYLLCTKIATHYNLGVTYTPDAKNADGSRFDQTVYNYGLSFILLLSKNFNFMFEVAGNRTFVKAVNTKTIISNSLFINPGMRYAINFKSGLQIVPGVAVPIGIGSSKGLSGVYAYLSFEHPLWKPKANHS